MVNVSIKGCEISSSSGTPTGCFIGEHLPKLWPGGMLHEKRSKRGQKKCRANHLIWEYAVFQGEHGRLMERDSCSKVKPHHRALAPRAGCAESKKQELKTAVRNTTKHAKLLTKKRKRLLEAFVGRKTRRSKFVLFLAVDLHATCVSDLRAKDIVASLFRQRNAVSHADVHHAVQWPIFRGYRIGSPSEVCWFITPIASIAIDHAIFSSPSREWWDLFKHQLAQLSPAAICSMSGLMLINCLDWWL